MQNEFTPQLIGTPDARKRAKIRELYELLTIRLSDVAGTLNGIYFQYGADQKDYGHLEFTDVSSFVLAKNRSEAESKIYADYSVIRKVEIPGISWERLVEQKLLDIPSDFVQECLKGRDEIIRLLADIESQGFIYPLRKLWISQGGEYEFKINNCFVAELEKHVSIFTECELQNQILDFVNDLVKSLNQLHNKKLIRHKNGIAETSEFIESVFECARFAEVDPISINSKLFSRWSRELAGLPKYKPEPGKNYKRMFDPDPVPVPSPEEPLTDQELIPDPEQVDKVTENATESNL